MLPFERMKREIFVRKKAKTNTKHGEDINKRSIQELLNYGIVNVNKPSGPTSHQVSSYVQKILGISKSGHSGTLDPKVTGVLPVALGRGTRIVQTLLPAGKEYICIMHLHAAVDEKILRTVLKSFIGKIKQLPPIKSSVKRQERYRKIYYLDVIEIVDQDVLFRVGCQAGTYIRKLCHDIGQALHCGAHMAELIRTKAGPFEYTSSCTLQDLTDAFYYCSKGNDTFIRKLILPIEEGVRHLPKVFVLDSSIDSICHGVNLKTPGIAHVESDIQVGEMIAIMSLKEELVAVGTTKMISKQMVNEEKGIAINVEKVFMQPGLYPKMEIAKEDVPKNKNDNI